MKLKLKLRYRGFFGMLRVKIRTDPKTVLA